MTLVSHLDADRMRSLEDTMSHDFRFWPGVMRNGNSSIDYAKERPEVQVFPWTLGNDVRTSTQPESLILAQSERWRQA